MNEQAGIAVETASWQRTSPLAIVYFFGKILQYIAKNLTQTIVPLAALVFTWPGSLVMKLAVGAAVFLLVISTVAFLRYWNFGFRISDDAIAIREGVLKKTLLDIKFDRIQAINNRQNILFRYFKLTNLKFDTAGSSRQEGVLPAVNIPFSDDLKERLRHTVNTAAGAAPLPDSPDMASDLNDSRPLRTVLKLSLAEVLKVGFASNRALIFVAFLAPFIEEITDNLGGEISRESILGAASFGDRVGISGGLIIVLAVVAGIWSLLKVISMLGALLKYYGFELTTDGNVLRSTGGLLTRHEFGMRFNKMQILRMSQGLTFRWFDRFELRARQASSGAQGSGKCFTIPSASSAQLDGLGRMLFGHELADMVLNPHSAAYKPISRLYIWTRLKVIGLFPALTALMVLFPLHGISALWVMLWIPAALLVIWQRFRRYGVQITNDGLAVRYGFIANRVGAFAFRKVQRISLSQSPFQRRKGVANIRLDLGYGSVRIPFMEIQAANQLRDFVLYCVESSELAWH